MYKCIYLESFAHGTQTSPINLKIFVLPEEEARHRISVDDQKLTEIPCWWFCQRIWVTSDLIVHENILVLIFSRSTKIRQFFFFLMSISSLAGKEEMLISILANVNVRKEIIIRSFILINNRDFSPSKISRSI